MYLMILWLPLISAIVAGMLGRQIGKKGASQITVISILITWIMAIGIFYEVILKKAECYMKLTTWVLVDFGLQYDGLTAIMCVVVTSISLLVHLYSTEYMGEDPHLPRFMSYLSLFTWFMLILVTADNLMQMFVGWEGVGLCSYLLINYWYTRIQANKSAIQAMIVNRIGDLGIVMAIIISYTQYKTLEYSVLIPIVEGAEIEVIGMMILLGAIGKSAQIGLHVWLANAMEGLVGWALQGKKLCYMREHPEQILWSTPKIGLGKIQRSGQSAGNWKETGSSETTRKAYDETFVEWLIGFTEGDGSLIVNGDGTLEFKITQSTTDADVLFEIKKTLGFGVVSKQCEKSNTHHYRVRDEVGLGKIIELMNGKIQLKKRQEQWKAFVGAYNARYKTKIEVKENIDLLSLERGWIAGFIEAEGCFTASVRTLQNNKVGITVRMIIAQKGEENVLQQIGKLCGGRVSPVVSGARVLKDGSQRPAYEGHIMTINLTYLAPIIAYIEKHPLKTKKRLAYSKWWEVYKIVIAQKHLGNPEVVESLRQKVKQINPKAQKNPEEAEAEE